MQTVLGGEHPSTLTTMNNLASVLDSYGKYAEAETMFQQTLAMRETVLSSEHPDILQSMNNLAHVLYSQGKYNKAISLYERTCISLAKVLGEEHPNTCVYRENYTQVIASQRQAQSVHVSQLTVVDTARSARRTKESALSRIAGKFGLKSSGPRTQGLK
jgi:tetratricopeptide (TPR) repeat protein